MAASAHPSAQKNALPIKLYPTTADALEVLTAYQQALTGGAVMVVGPLTRDAVAALAASSLVKMPTLALNTLDDDRMVIAPQLYFFGLQTENEARFAARLAGNESRRHAVIINDGGALSKRLQAAFTDEWLKSSAASAKSVPLGGDAMELVKLRKLGGGEDTLFFLALDEKKARIARPYLDPAAPVYATSQVFGADANNSLLNHDLEGVRFADMPWLLQPDHAAVMIYPRTTPPLGADMERLYALGIDAFRLAEQIRAAGSDPLNLDGVSGRIRWVASRQLFLREPVAATFRNGEVSVAP